MEGDAGRARILVIGLTAAGAAGLPAGLQARVREARLLVGGARQLAAFPGFQGETLAIGATVEPALTRLAAAWAQGERAVVLASGDPLWYGIGTSLRRVLPAAAFEIVPAPTAAQLAFAALAEPWHDALLLSAHGRPLAEVVAAALAAPKAAILTDNHNTPAALACALLAAGLPPTARCAVCENLGGPEQQVSDITLAEAAERAFAPLNVVVVWPNDAGSFSPRETRDNRGITSPLAASGYRLAATAPGLPDEAFATTAGLITKREVRLLSLAELTLGLGEVLWDIGAGSGAVAIEAARSQPAAQVFAIERRQALITHIEENLRRFPAPNLRVVAAEAPDACTELPDPQAVFVGGSGGRLAAIIRLAQERLSPGGRLVVNLATIEHLAELRALLPAARATQVQISRGAPIEGLLRFAALNPIFIVVWRKE